MRLIPKNTKVKTVLYRSITFADVILGVCVLAICALIVSTNLPYKLFIALGFACLTIPLFLSISDERLYMSAVFMLKHLFSRKKYTSTDGSIEGLIPFDHIEDTFIINKDGSFVGAIEIKPIEFRLLAEEKQNYFIDGMMTNALTAITYGQQGIILRLEKTLTLDDTIKTETERITELIQNYEKGCLSRNEYRTRLDILEARITELDSMNSESEIHYSGFYLCIIDRNKSAMQNTLSYIRRQLLSGGIAAEILCEENLTEFVSLSGQYKNLSFRLTDAITEKIKVSHIAITGYPLKVYNSWADELYDMPGTKVMMKLDPVEKLRAVKRIDNAINELSTRKAGKASKIIDQSTHIETLSALLTKIQNDNEALFDVTTIITVYDEPGDNANKKRVKQKLRELGFTYNDLIGRQQDAYLSAGLSFYDKLKLSRGIQASSVAASFPFVSDAILEEKGLLIGENKLPVIIDFFKRDESYVNSNMVIIGKPGSGKSYAAKSMIANLATMDCKIVIADPENEYTKLTESLNGKVLDASSAKYGKLNPFHIIQSLEDENDDGGDNSFYTHLLFLEEFMRVILPGINTDCLEMLNKLIQEMYTKEGITAESDLRKLKPADYPTFEDLGGLVDFKLKVEKDTYTVSCLKTIQNYISKFRTGGRYSALWNGPSSFDAKENLVCFNFQKLLANKNNLTAAAQMLLILKWVENEVIKNREYNERNGTDRKIVIVADEFHLFVDDKQETTLSTFQQLAKRIRKYDGMTIFITQSLKDFTGSPEIMKKSMAIINVSQYSLIFSLSPNDMTDLCALYEKAGQINESEQNTVVYNPRGCAFLIASPTMRTNIRIVTPVEVEQLFMENNK